MPFFTLVDVSVYTEYWPSLERVEHMGIIATLIAVLCQYNGESGLNANSVSYKLVYFRPTWL